MSEQANPFIKKMPEPKPLYDATRVPHLEDGVIYASQNPKIRDLLTTNGDNLFGPGIYTANMESARRYRARRSESNPGASLFKIDASGKNLFDGVLLRGLCSIVDGETKLYKMLRSTNERVSIYAESIKGQLQLTTSNFISFLENNKENWLDGIPIGVRKSMKNLIDKVITDNQRELQKSKEGQDFVLPYFAINEKDTMQAQKTLYYFGKFLSEATDLDGLINIERADWNIHLPLGQKNRSRVYVFFDKTNTGIPAQKLIN